MEIIDKPVASGDFRKEILSPSGKLAIIDSSILDSIEGQAKLDAIVFPTRNDVTYSVNVRADGEFKSALIEPSLKSDNSVKPTDVSVQTPEVAKISEDKAALVEARKRKIGHSPLTPKNSHMPAGGFGETKLNQSLAARRRRKGKTPIGKKITPNIGRLQKHSKHSQNEYGIVEFVRLRYPTKLKREDLDTVNIYEFKKVLDELFSRYRNGAKIDYNWLYEAKELVNNVIGEMEENITIQDIVNEVRNNYNKR